MTKQRYADCTGRLVQLLPPGDERDEFLGLVRLGIKFNNRLGRRLGVLAQHVRATVKTTRPESFDNLLIELELHVMRHQLLGEGPIVKVDRQWEVVRYIEAGEEREATFKRVQNIAQIRKSREPR